MAAQTAPGCKRSHLRKLTEVATHPKNWEMLLTHSSVKLTREGYLY